MLKLSNHSGVSWKRRNKALKTVHSLSASSHSGKGLIFPRSCQESTPRDPAFVHQLQPWFQSDLHPCF
ncbi:hypothetical protein CHARACLAT_030930 [Characodon lateralis]|uniref:Uncharacterized protein n=1 Tax=Characodon lateralis TaxID=208331 RepID=A0ABU7CVP8_9TELE|nr:hypothetical protein [Characodon lateralis]